MGLLVFRGLILFLFLSSIAFAATPAPEPKHEESKKEVAPAQPQPAPKRRIVDSSEDSFTPPVIPPPFVPHPPPASSPIPQSPPVFRSSGGGGGSPSAPYVFFSPKPPVLEPPRPRPLIFYTNAERKSGSTILFKPVSTNPSAAREKTQEINELSLTLDTVKREAEGDVLRAQHEHEFDLANLETQRKLHAQSEALYKTNATSEFEYVNSLTRFLRSQAKAEESKHKIEEQLTSVAIDSLKLEIAKGTDSPHAKLANLYAHLWEVRVSRAKAVAQGTLAELNYLSFINRQTALLKEKQAASETEVIRAERDEAEARVVHKLAESLVEKTIRDAEETQRTAHEAESAAKTQ